MTRILVMPALPYSILYDPDFTRYLAHIERKYYSLIKETIEKQFRYEPAILARNRKPMSETFSFGEAWELRFGPNNRFRVIYRIDDSLHQVRVLGIFVKFRDRYILGDEEFEI
jgi:mRNA-degrading endonuclease RelE of RelBE toxin-antitoxin system